ncbi:MAG: flagellar hook-associated protein 3 FlgL [Gammaproteobacteria bacterium]|jgi:flagellar hook-associated protein 3 FlgL|nr:flagellar hook-associated protein 3 FlgL [Gammaproteobacteria bacterium]
MRVTQSLNQLQFVAAIDTLQSNLSQTQNQISTNLSFTTPSQNPVAAGAVNGYNQALAQSKQYDTNANSAQTRLSTEDSALTQVQNALQSLRTLALQANSGTLSSQDRGAIATQATQIQASLVSLANTQDGNGEYLFSGFATQTKPFALSPTGATYSGDQGQRQLQIAAGQSVADGDNGDTVFNQIKTGNGTFVATSGSGNTGTGVLGATTVVNASAYNGQPYSIKFSAVPATGLVANTYTILDSTGAAVVPAVSGTYTSGQSIAYDGTQVTITGQPGINDTFSVAPSTNQSVFTTVQNMVTALQSPATSSAGLAQLNNALNGAINNIDQALNQTSDVRSSIGGRLNSITTQLSVSSSQQIQLQTSISSLQSLDYASALTQLQGETTTLSAAMQAYTITQGLSLFKYL